MDDSHSAPLAPSFRTQPTSRRLGSRRLIRLLANPILLATWASSTQACPPLAAGSHCKHTIRHPNSHTCVIDCRPIGTWTMVQGPNSFPSCGPCGCGEWQSEWLSPNASNPTYRDTAPPLNAAPTTTTSPLDRSQPTYGDAAQPKPPLAEPLPQGNRSSSDQPTWRPPTSQVPKSPLPSPDAPTSEPSPLKAPTTPVPKAEEGPLKDLELLFGDPPPAAPSSKGDPAQSRWAPRNSNLQGNDLSPRYADARFSSASSLPLEHQDWRTWTDHTGTYQVRARLIEAGPYHLVLLKENGRTTTLPISRLSPQDAVYLRLGK